MDLYNIDLNKLKVPELRKELQIRNLDYKGNKPVLVQRLKETVEREKLGLAENVTNVSEKEKEVESTSEENSLLYTTAASDAAALIQESSCEKRAFSVITSNANEDAHCTESVNESAIKPTSEEKISIDTLVTSQFKNKQLVEGQTHDEISVDETASTHEMYDSDSQQRTYDLQETIAEQETDSYRTSTVDLNQLVDQDQSTIDCEQFYDSNQSYNSANLEPEPIVLFGSKEQIQNMNEETMDVSESIVQGSERVTELQEQPAVAPPMNDHIEFEEQNKSQEIPMDTSSNEQPQESEDNFVQEKSDSQDVAIVETLGSRENSEASVEEPKKRVRKSRFDQPGETNNMQVTSNDLDENYNPLEEEQKRKHSPSPSRDDASLGGYEMPPKVVKQDDEPSFSDETVLLSWYDSDLNLTIFKENFVKAVPLHDEGFMYMWAGVRSTFGFQSGKVYFDVKLVEKTVNVTEEFEIYSFRVGWSTPYTSRQLGEVPLSYGYDSSGKKCVDNNFEDYGQPYNAEDIIGCLVDFESDEQNVLITYTFNGISQDVAFEVPKEQLDGKALYPHVLSKNITFEVNFGDREEPWDLQQKFEGDFEWASKVLVENRVKGPRKPEEKKDCEVILMCGLPCSGKSTWIKKHYEENPEKMYNVLGIDDVLLKMTVLNEPMVKHFKEETNSLIEKCTNLVNRLFELAIIRWRNYILDQTNLFLTHQRRKMRAFEGFTRMAVVISPNENEYEKLKEKWDENTLRDSSISLLELKSNFKLPEEGELFEKVIIVGSTQEEAEELIRKYNKEGRDARRDDRGFNRGFRESNRDYGRPMGVGGGGGGYRSRWMGRGPPPGGRGGWGHRGMDRMPSGGGYRDRRGWRDREDNRGYRDRYPPRDGGRYGGGSMMSGGNRWIGGGGSRDRDRMGGPPRPGSAANTLMGPLMGPPGVEENDEMIDKGPSRGGNDEGRRPSRFSDGLPGGYRGRGGGGFRGNRGGERINDGVRGMGGNRFGQFRPSNGRDGVGGPRSGGLNSGGYVRGGRDDGRYYSGRGGWPPSRDNRDNRNPMSQQRSGGGGGMNRFDKRDSNSGRSGVKNDLNQGGNANQQQAGWGMYGQPGWGQYANWAQYQQAAGYTPQQIQQYWSQLQQHQQQQQQQQQNSNLAQGSQQGSKSTTGAGQTTTSNSSSNAAKSGSLSTGSANASAQLNSGGYGSQGYNTGGFNTQGYDPNTYAQYCAYYNQMAAQQGWPQNADGTYSYPQNAWATQYANYNYVTAAAAGGAAAEASSTLGGSTTGSGGGTTVSSK